MKKNWLAAAFVCCLAIPAFSQTLFTYGTHKVEAAEFLRAFSKNNSPAANRAKAIREYLDLYIVSRLKIQDAYDRGYDALPQVNNEIQNLRSQIIETYMSDPQAIERLSKEAFRRSLKDIHAAHIFIADNPADTAAARQKLNTVLKALQKGTDFLSVAQQFSDDPFVKDNKGDLGYLTVFSLPYELENILYAVQPGAYSKPYRSKAGYHLLKNLGERKAIGKIKIQQILLTPPPGTGEAGKQRAAQLADSLYQRIRAGDDFGRLASLFSNDYISAASNGNLPDIGVGQYEPAFEKLIWSLPYDGAVSQPFLSSHGYHIVKRVALKPIVTNPSDSANKEALKQKVQADDRWKTARDFIYARIRSKGEFEQFSYSEAAFQAWSDSLLDRKPLAGSAKTMNPRSPLFRIGNMVYTVSDWVNYAQPNRYTPGSGHLRPYSNIMEDFIKSNMYQYYRNHLEDFNDAFRIQMNEFRDGNLFFEAMQQQVWDKAQNDSAALLALYEKDKARYNWKPSAEAVIFYCVDEALARSLAGQVKKNPAGWKRMVDSLIERASADSGRFEWAQLPGLGNTIPRPGMITSPVVNESEGTASFAYVLQLHPQPETRSFEDAKGLVINDYQALLEEEWIKELKKKYPVVIDQNVLAKITK